MTVMKHLIFILPLSFIFFCCSSSPQRNKVEERKYNSLRDSIALLIQRGTLSSDTVMLQHALALSDSLLRNDTVRIARLYCYFNRAEAYNSLGDSTKAIQEYEKGILLMPENHTTRTAYFAGKFKSLGIEDSTKYYFDKTIAIYDKLLRNKDQMYISNVLGKALVIDGIKGRKETLQFLNDELKKHPEDDELKHLIRGVRDEGMLDKNSDQDTYATINISGK